MKVWLVCFVLFFGLAELYPWITHVKLPFPVLLLAGGALAIASNLDKRAGLPWKSAQPEAIAPTPVAPATVAPTPIPPAQTAPVLQQRPAPELPHFLTQPSRRSAS